MCDVKEKTKSQKQGFCRPLMLALSPDHCISFSSSNLPVTRSAFQLVGFTWAAALQLSQSKWIFLLTLDYCVYRGRRALSCGGCASDNEAVLKAQDRMGEKSLVNIGDINVVV